MVETVYAKTRADLRAFFEIGEGYLEEERRYLSACALPEINPLCANGESAYLLAVRNGRPVYRAFTGIDRAYQRISGKRQGYFALFDGQRDEEAAFALLSKILALQKAWGAECVVGPVSPDGSGFFMGAGEGNFSGARGVLTGAENSFSAGILRRAGFSVFAREGAFFIRMPMENPFSELSGAAVKRFGLRVERMKRTIFSEDWKRRILSVSGGSCPGELLRILEKTGRFIAPGHSYFAMRNGECLAYLLSFHSKNSMLRCTTLMTREGAFTPPLALVLTDAFLTGARGAGVEEYEASVIDERNSASLGVISRVNGEKRRLYTQFIKNI